MAAKSKWDKVGELRKTKRGDMLVGHIEVASLGIKLRVVAFIKTGEQKKNQKEPDIVILLPKEGGAGPELSDNLFD